MRSDDSVVLLVIGPTKRLDSATVLQAADQVSREYHGPLGAGAREAAAAKIFCTVNDDATALDLAEVDAALRKVMGALSPDYAVRMGQRGPGRPYFIVRPLDSLHIENPEEANADSTSNASYAVHIGAALHRLGRSDVAPDALPDDVAKLLLNASEIPLLRERIAEYLRAEQVDRLLDQVADHLTAALDVTRTDLGERLKTLKIDPSGTVDLEGLRWQRGQDAITERLQTLPATFVRTMNTIAERTPAWNATAYTEAIRVASDVRARCAELVEELTLEITTLVFGRYHVSFDAKRAALVLDDELHRRFRAVGHSLAERHIASLRGAVISAGVAADLDAQQRELPGNAPPVDPVGDFLEALNHFAVDYRAAVTAAVLFAYGSDPGNAMSERVEGLIAGSDDPAEPLDWVSELHAEVGRLATTALTETALRHGLEVVFQAHWADLRDRLAELVRDSVRVQLFAFGADPAYRERVLGLVDGELKETMSLLARWNQVDTLIQAIRAPVVEAAA